MKKFSETNSMRKNHQALFCTASPPSRLAPTTLIGVSTSRFAAGDGGDQGRDLLRDALSSRAPSL